MQKFLINNWKPLLVAIGMWPLIIIVPAIIGFVLPGGWSTLQQYPQDDSIEVEFLIRILLIGSIPAAIFPKHFYWLPIVSWLALAIFIYLWQLLESGFDNYSLELLLFGGAMALPFIALTFIGSFASRIVHWLYRITCK